MLKILLKFTNTISFKPQLRFASKKITDIIEDLSSKIYEQSIIKNVKEEQVLKNYIQLTEESYLQHLAQDMKIKSSHQKQIDPKILLMILPTLQKEQAIRQHLILLFPHIASFNSKELLLFFEYLLAYKLSSKPKIPSPKPINNCESLLVLLSELYPKDFLIEWLGQVPLYNGDNTYMVSMGAFSIISGMSQKVKAGNKKLINRCFQRIKVLYQQQNSEVRIGVILLGLQMQLKFIEQLILIPYSLDFRQIDGIKISLLIIELDRYLKQNYSNIQSVSPHTKPEVDQELQQIEIEDGTIPKKQQTNKFQSNRIEYEYNPNELEHIKFKLEQYLLKLVSVLTRQDWKNIIKLHTLVRLFEVLNQKKLEKGWLKFSDKLFKFTLNKEQIVMLSNLTTNQLVGMVQVLEKQKINNPPLLKNLLVVLSDRLEDANKQELIRLSKCLVTYVRVCEDYLIHFRVIIERRKFIFSSDDIQALNAIFRRVQVLFPKPLTY